MRKVVYVSKKKIWEKKKKKKEKSERWEMLQRLNNLPKA